MKNFIILNEKDHSMPDFGSKTIRYCIVFDSIMINSYYWGNVMLTNLRHQL